MRALAGVVLLACAASGGGYDDEAGPKARAEALERLRVSGDVAALLGIVAKSTHPDDRLEAMRLLAPHADRRAVARLFAVAGRKGNELLATYLERCLPGVRDAKARTWVVDHGLRSGDERLCCASIVAVRAWKAKEAVPGLLRVAEEQLRRGASRSAAVLYEAARTLAGFEREGVTELLLRCAKDEDWRARLAAAEARTTIVLRDDPHPLVRRAARGTTDAPGPVVFVLEKPRLGSDVSWGLCVNRVRTTLRELPPTRSFNVVVFGDAIESWREAPVAASRADVFEAGEWLGKRPHVRDPRPLRDALAAALEQRGVTEIRLYATGANDEAMTGTLVRLYALNRFAHARIDTVGLAGSELLPAIARQTGGTHRMLR